uniref:Uncharacterized protein n=1 Tax=Rhizophora mucronata TaxID=61149 RepID=A0A2P2NW84_RHIMU
MSRRQDSNGSKSGPIETCNGSVPFGRPGMRSVINPPGTTSSARATRKDSMPLAYCRE